MAVLGERAVVLGASMSGLLAATLLADFYRTVMVVERDVLPDEPVNRRGVPQGRHAHTLLAGGSRALGDLFPGILAEIAADGAPVWDNGEFSWFYVSLGGHLVVRSARMPASKTASVTPKTLAWAASRRASSPSTPPG